MSEAGRFAYAQVRLQARYGLLPDAALWRRLESITDLSHLLQTARTTGLRPWLLNIATQGDSHAMEKSLHLQLRQHIDEVARWLPAAWRPAVRWCDVLPDLPALQHLLGGDSVPAWLRDDDRLKSCTHELQPQRLQALRDSPYAPLLDDGADLITAWHAHWRTLWPRETSRNEQLALQALGRLLAAYYADLRVAEHAGTSASARERLEQRLRAGFRRHPHQAATAFYYLALAALILERLRGLLAQQILFPLERAS